MYRVLCDGYVLHDSNLEEFTLINPVLDLEVNKSGQFSFQIAYNHKYYNKIFNKKSYIEIYEDGVWVWSGRPLKINMGMKLSKTVTCEGELSYLHDSFQRVAEYHEISVADYFTTLIANHNADVDESKQFVVGNVTVTDPNDSLYRMSSYEDTFESIQTKLLDKLGGYLVIRHEAGVRYLDYVETYPEISNQIIRLGSNIIDIVLDDTADDMISAIIPLGAKLNKINENSADLEETRLTIESVNDGLDYIVNEEAVERIGLIKDIVIFDDVTLASNLLSKGYEELASRIYSNLEISLAIFDRSYIEKNIDKFKLGARVVADSAKHGLNNQQMMIDKISISLVDVTKTKIETGLTKRSLTDSFVDSNNQFDTKVETIVRDYVTNEEVTVITPQIQELTSLIEQTATSIRTEIAGQYLEVSEKEEMYAYLSSLIEQTESDITMTFREDITNIENTVVLNQQNLERYIRFSTEGIELGDYDSPFKTNITTTEIYFSQSGQKIAYISNSKLYILEAEFINKISIGEEELGFYDWMVRSNKHLSLKWRGSE